MKKPGARLNGGAGTFTVWAPLRKDVSLHIIEPSDQLIEMEADKKGFWSVTVPKMKNGALYKYRLDDSVEWPDPASHAQPQGVHGPSMLVDHSEFLWTDESVTPTLLNDYIIYELHIGTFSKEGNFEGAIQHLSHLVELGITAVEIMPVAQFPGSRNWGYDGAYPYAVQESYGGVTGLKNFVNECHKINISVILDVVYNHLGPEGNYLREFGPYFTNRYKTPWGDSLNFDGAYSDCVNEYFIGNAIYWLREFHIDALRLDAVHAICDFGAKPFLERLSQRVEEEFGHTDSPKFLIAESDLNDARIIRPRSEGGFQMDSQWNDDFHHAIHTVISGETNGYYSDFGSVKHLEKVLQKGFAYNGNYSKARKRSHGNDVEEFHTSHFVVCAQNHDQIGNRLLGERLSSLADIPKLKLSASILLLSPYLPLLFMGEEYAETNPFLYFADHTDAELRDAVKEGRKAEFLEFHVHGEAPDAFALQTFEKCKLDWDKLNNTPNSEMFKYYKHLIQLRKSLSALGATEREALDARLIEGTKVISLLYGHPIEAVRCLFNFSGDAARIPWEMAGNWKKRFDSEQIEPGDIIPDVIPNITPDQPIYIDTPMQIVTVPPFGCHVYVKRGVE